MELPLLLNTIYAFIGFSFVASAIYIMNDWKDIEADRLHPEKKNRPLASNKVTKKEAAILMGILILSGFSIYAFAFKEPSAILLLLFYFVMNVAYTFKLKYVSIIDVAIVATGFVIRIFVGGAATDIYLSHWLIIITFLLALLIAIGKRRDDVLIYLETGTKTRKVVEGYNIDFINVIMTVLVSVIVVAYVMYTVSSDAMERHGEYLYVTLIFVFLGLMRYLQLIYVYKKSGNPTVILVKDKFILFTVIAWVITFLIV
jgi:4-hydroxybenzoate polyprenyltransferase